MGDGILEFISAVKGCPPEELTTRDGPPLASFSVF
jgi:hypothetical protein